ncbi:hypothetical protein PHYBOEH_001779 [Phytophthora boehmeriae]|uniref:Uncharacterized protein n=1 Tax=Phytophthora boehmeriae TaxID=109152 RepID=A0A8T1XBE4_9STRA|nr:hypothetical protein PHYBOEH_001779 [Phytophthora boehmeriae]
MDPGYGICGHKNSFSTGVKIGNYVEDRVGADLARNSSTKPINKLTECSASYINPREMTDKCTHAPAENLVERNTIRQGLSYDLIFEHGRPHVPTPAEHAVRYTLTSHDFGSGLSAAMKGSVTSHESTRRRQLEMKKAREAREYRQTYMSTTQALVPVYGSASR